MRWAIRQQILVPIVLIQTLSVVAITVASVVLAERRAEREIINRLVGVLDVLGKSHFPLNSETLGRMQGLSGARFIAYDGDGRAVAGSEPGLVASAPALSLIPAGARNTVSSLSDYSLIKIDGQDHLSVLIAAGQSLPRRKLLVLYPEASWRESRSEAAQVPLLLGPSALVLMALVTIWIAHRISARLRRLDQQVARIADGDFVELPFDPGERSDEIQDLAGSINLMCGQLRRMSRTVRESERAQLLAQLAAGLAHQLRNALTGARLSVQLHQRRCKLSSAESSMSTALKQLALVEEQVRGLLTLGQGDSRPRRRTNVSQLLHDVALLVQPGCDHAGVELRVESDLEDVEASLDEAGVRAAVLNLALNAIEAASRGGTVALELIEDSRALTIRVSDTGAGPAMSVSDRLFEPFVTGKPEGIGLGLVLARQVAEAHHGSLSWVRDEGWTRFLLMLPQKVAAREPIGQ